ncbi:MAG: NAD(P)H-hydrate dehydratase [Gammaproteobacteria bacterium]|nr:NAD(P)H-hydrate dehydratase [Gammaproteobacteria bacterium]
MKNKLYIADQVRQLDRFAIEGLGISGCELMERSGKQAFQRILDIYQETKSFLVLCGPGNNGGDGYVVALCALELGMQVEVIFTEKPKTPDAKLMYHKYLKAGGIANQYNPLDQTLPVMGDLIIDAILGIGINHAPGGSVEQLINDANQDARSIFALDVPSGLECDTGVAFESCITATNTVNFIGRKVGCYTADGRDQCGTLFYEPLNVPLEGSHEDTHYAELIEPFPLDSRVHNSHKRRYGDLAIFGGFTGMFGAVLLAGRAAMRAGCGLTTVVSKQKHADILAVHCPELMSLDFAKEKKVEDLLERVDALVVGPGLDDGKWAQRVFSRILDFHGPVVVDAGALRILAKPAYRMRRDNWILTPHPGEAAALLDCDSMDIQTDRIESAREITSIYGGICILKGSGTIVAYSESETPKICDRGNPGMATAGMGDVLSGILGAYSIYDMSISKCAELGVWVHSYAADLAIEESTEHSLIASDVIDVLPKVYQALENQTQNETE